MNSYNVTTTALAAVRSHALLAAVFLICFIFIGLPLGHLLGMRRAGREMANYLRRTGVEHIPKLGEDRMPFIVYLSAQLCIGYRLLFLKGKLLVQQAFLKTVGQATRQPSAKQRAERDAPSPGKENFVCHSDMCMQANDQVERQPPTETPTEERNS